MLIRTLLSKLFNKFIQLIPNEYNEEIFYRIGRMLGVRSFACGKELGLFEGSIDDNTVHRYYFRHGNWAPDLQYILRNLFADSPGTYIDIGANIGLTVIPIAMINNFIDLYAFEPEINNYNFLRKNIIGNNLEFKIKAFNIALFSDDCTIDLELSENNVGDHRVRVQSVSDSHNNHHDNLHATVKVNARKLDSVLNVNDLIKPIVLKVDTQGAEVRVLGGATNLLKEVDYLIVEYWPYGLQRMGDTTEEFFNIIEQFPFGATYDDDFISIPKLSPIAELIAQIDSSFNKVSIGHLDIILSRHQELNQRVKSI